MSWQRALPLAELPEGQVREVVLAGEPIALCRLGPREVYAVESACTHDGAPLGVGRLDGAVVQCPRHGARFDVRDGRVLRLPAAAPLQTYPVRISDDAQVEVEIEEQP